MQNQWFSIFVSVALKSTVVLGAAWLIAIVLRKRSAAARHLVWSAAAAAVIALPLLSVSLPSLRLPAPRAIAMIDTGLVFQAFAVAGNQPASAVRVSSPTPNPQPPTPFSFRAGTVVAIVWALGTALSLLQMLLGYAAMSRRRRTAPQFPGVTSPAPDPWPPTPFSVPVLETTAGSMPVAFGIRRPVIFLPADAAEWTPERRRVVLMHEVAHVWRGDTATHLLARTALSLNWWNPLAWLAWREFLKERERAADDIVLESGAQASDYAGHLLDVARSLQTAHEGSWAAVAMARRSQLEGRLLAILDSRVNRKAAGRAALVCATTVALVLVAPFAAIRAQQPVSAEVDATILAANAQKNHQMLEQAASQYEKLRQYDAAQKLLESALTIRGEVAGQQSPDYQMGLMKLGDLSVARGKFHDANDFYSRAIGLGDRPEIAPALLYVGRSKISNDPAGAFDLLQRAVNVDPAGPTAGPAYTWMAMARERQPEVAADAEMYYQRALNTEPPTSTEAATTMELYALYLRNHERTGEADLMSSRAKEIRQAHVKDLAVSLPRAGVGSAQTRLIIQPNDAVKVGTGVTAPKLLHKVEPAYTEEARAAKYQGTCILYIVVGTDGMAHNISVVRSLGLGLDEMAVEAVSQWQFQPGTKDGQPVNVMATIEVNFRLM